MSHREIFSILGMAALFLPVLLDVQIGVGQRKLRLRMRIGSGK
jgi:hypothetical protein